MPQEVFHGQRTAQGKKAQGRAVAENIDVGTQIAGLRDARLLESGDVDYARGQAGQQHWMGDVIKTKLAVFRATGTWNLIDVPGEAVLRASNRIHHTKDDDMADIECHKA